MAKYHIFKHLHTVNKHRWLVFLNCCRCGIPWRGLTHDLSKYSFLEFFTSAKYYSGTKSPIANERKAEHGYARAFIHHTRKNKHHFEYWVDVTTGDIILIPMPYKYALECCCDMISASKVYNGKNFTREEPLKFIQRTKERSMMHSATKAFLEEIMTRYKDTGFKNLKKKDTKKIYQECLARFQPTEIIPVYSAKHPEETYKHF